VPSAKSYNDFPAPPQRPVAAADPGVQTHHPSDAEASFPHRL